MQLALSDYRNSMEDVLRELQKAWNLTQEFDGPQMYAGAIKSDLELVGNPVCKGHLCGYCTGIDRASCLCATCGGTGLWWKSAKTGTGQSSKRADERYDPEAAWKNILSKPVWSEGFSLQTAADGTCLTRISPRVYRGLWQGKTEKESGGFFRYRAFLHWIF